MADNNNKDKDKLSQQKNIPKDGQVILAIMKEMGINDYDPKCVVQLMEFVYKYATNVLEEARMYANNSKKKFLEVVDVELALQLCTESSFTTPPPREVVLECANVKNYTPLPLIKHHCGLRLPPDRYCLSACNYTLKTNTPKKKPPPQTFSIPVVAGGIKVSKPGMAYIKRTPMSINKQTVTIAKPITKIANVNNNNNNNQKSGLKPKIQISSNHNVHTVNSSTPNGVTVDVDNSLKRKRDDDSDSVV